MEHVTTSITNEDIFNGINDEYDILYSRDGKRLLKCQNNYISSYKVKDGAEIICDGAFKGQCKHDCIYYETINGV